jgi:hypothetical protein
MDQFSDASAARGE